MAEAEEIENLEPVELDSIGSRRRSIAVHGYDLNDTDESIALAVRVFDGGPTAPPPCSPRQPSAPSRP